MSQYKIAVTGVGGGVGQSVIKSLYGSEYELVGLDGELLATGLYAVPTSYIIPYASSPEYIPTLLDICRREGIALLFPGLDAELKVLSLHRDAFRAAGTVVMVSEPSVIDVSDNKLLTYQRLTAAGVNVPFTSDLQDFDGVSGFPVIIKQKVGGARSKNVFFVKNAAEFQRVSREIANKENYVVQEYIEGDEYTCGSICLEGECKGVIVMRRILRDGDTYKCFSEKNAVIEQAVKKVINELKPFGSCNVQLRMREGVPYIFEINARCSGTTASRSLCGFNEPCMIADYLLKGIQPQYEIKEQTILRYWKELVVDNNKVSSLTKSQFYKEDKLSYL